MFHGKNLKEHSKRIGENVDGSLNLKMFQMNEVLETFKIN